MIIGRWKGYFDKLLNEENPRSMFDDGVPNKGLTQGISRNEVKVAISRMKNGKATGMDGIPVEVWKCLGEEGIDMLWDLMKGIYEKEKIPTEWRDSVIIPIYKENEGARTRVKSSVGLTDMIPVGVVLHQGSSLSPYLISMIMDVLARGIKDISPWCMLYADDIVLWGTRSEVVEKKLEEWRRAMEDRGLKINRKKTVYLRFNVDRDLDDGNSDVNIQGDNLERVNTFKYLGATLAENGDLDAEVTHRIQSEWKNWKRISGILCERRISLRVKGKVYKTVVRPAMMYGAETWAVKKAHEKKLDVAEMRMLRWMSGVTKMDRIRNERIRGTTKVEEISKKVQESRLKWYGHVSRREDEYVGKRVMGMEVPGKRRRGRPKRRWLDSIRNDLSERGLSEEDAQDRPRWRRLIRHIDHT